MVSPIKSWMQLNGAQKKVKSQRETTKYNRRKNGNAEALPFVETVRVLSIWDRGGHWFHLRSGRTEMVFR